MGRVACLLPAGGGREARRRRALLQPLCPVQCVVSVAPGRDVMPMREPVADPPLPMLTADPMRSVVALFLSEVLANVLRASQGEPLLFDFIADAARRLDADDAPLANFNIVFLTHLLDFLGVAPDMGGYRRGMTFDMLDALFRQTPALHGRCLGIEESEAVARIGRMDWDNAHRYKYTRAQRARVLDGILEYYSLHVVNLSSLKSLAVMRELFR